MIITRRLLMKQLLEPFFLNFILLLIINLILLSNSLNIFISLYTPNIFTKVVLSLSNIYYIYNLYIFILILS